MWTFNGHAGLSHQIGPPTKRPPNGSTLACREQRLSAVFVPNINPLAGNIQVQNLLRRLRESDVPLMGLPSLEASIRLRSIPELQIPRHRVIIPEVERQKPFTATTDVPQDFKDCMASSPTLLRALPEKRQQLLRILGRKLLIRSLIIVLEFHCINCEVDTQRDESL